MNVSRYEIIRGNGESTDLYPEYIRDMVNDILNFDNMIITDIAEVDNILTTIEDTGNEANKFAVSYFTDGIDKLIEEDTLCIICVKENDISKLGMTIDRQVSLLNMLGFVDLNMRFGQKNVRPMVYIRNTAGCEYYNTARFIVFDFLNNYGKIGGNNGSDK